MSQEKQNDELAKSYGFANSEELREFIRKEVKQAFMDGAFDREMSQIYGVHRRGR